MNFEIDWTYMLLAAGVVTLILALLLDFSRPKNQRIQWFSHDITEDQAHLYAPLYSKKDRLKQVMWLVIGAIPLLLLVKFVFNPWLQNMEQSFCKEWMGFSGMELNFFVIMLMVYVMLLGILFVFVRQIIQIKKSGQFPLPGAKTMSLTKITYGNKALVKPIIGLTLTVVLVVLSVILHFKINYLIDESQVKVIQHCQKLQKTEEQS
ncbi:hypothetical protein [Marinicella rhabdoformis]|uniref:hypothetical protein n=1 Tax=Marinicella rhabdoformis TaxID=2580566 RepID=UPI0012AEB4BD|nr:hypothetical protein [Marinicella rhabdoformis]